eukprot:6540915-Alexandrium_andersonii.AAC.1
MPAKSRSRNGAAFETPCFARAPPILRPVHALTHPAHLPFVQLQLAINLAVLEHEGAASLRTGRRGEG